MTTSSLLHAAHGDAVFPLIVCADVIVQSRLELAANSFLPALRLYISSVSVLAIRSPHKEKPRKVSERRGSDFLLDVKFLRFLFLHFANKMEPRKCPCSGHRANVVNGHMLHPVSGTQLQRLLPCRFTVEVNSAWLRMKDPLDSLTHFL